MSRLDDLSREFGSTAPAGPAGIAITHPQLFAQLDPDRNGGGDLTALTAGSARKLWWRCPRGHTWEASVTNRTKGRGCPTCAGRYPAGIATTHPHLAAQLDATRNPGVDPIRLTAGSQRKVWWRCPEGHVWRTAVFRRAYGTGCPVCATGQTARRRRDRWETRTVDHPLPFTHPAVAAGLDPDRNPNVDLERITAGSARKLWWRCSRGHQWEASVSSRTRGSGCPVCSGFQSGPLAVARPTVVAEFDADHNPGVDADHLHAGSHGLLWWRCPGGHRWQDSPSHRARGADCPTCFPTQPGGVRRTCTSVYADPADPRVGTRCRGAAVSGTDHCSAHQPGTARCVATTKAGRPCARLARREHDTCPTHDPTTTAVAVTLSPTGKPESPASPGTDKLACPVCGRRIGTRPGADTARAGHVVLATHNDTTGQRCPGRVVTIDC